MQFTLSSDQIECEVGSVVGVFGTTDASTFHLWVSHLVVAASLDYDILLKDDEELLKDCRWMRARRNDDAGGEVRAYLNNLDAQVGRIRNRLVTIDAKLWPDASPEFSEPRNKLGDGL